MSVYQRRSSRQDSRDGIFHFEQCMDVFQNIEAFFLTWQSALSSYEFYGTREKALVMVTLFPLFALSCRIMCPIPLIGTHELPPHSVFRWRESPRPSYSTLPSMLTQRLSKFLNHCHLAQRDQRHHISDSYLRLQPRIESIDPPFPGLCNRGASIPPQDRHISSTRKPHNLRSQSYAHLPSPSMFILQAPVAFKTIA